MSEQMQVRIGLSDIAEIAGVSLSAVSQWRKRHVDFPIPLADDTLGTVFDLNEVQDWLFRNGKTNESLSTEKRIWSSLNSIRTWWTPSSATDFLVNMLVLHKTWVSFGNQTQMWSRVLRDSESIFDEINAEILKTKIDQPYVPVLGLGELNIDRNVPEEVVASFLSLFAEQVQKNSSTISIFEALLEWRSRIDRFESTSTDSITNLLQALIPLDALRIADLAAGTGKLLHFSSDERSSTRDERNAVGFEINPQTLWLAKCRFYLSGEKLEAHVVNSLSFSHFENVQADAVICEPPMGIKLDVSRIEYLQNGRWKYGTPPVTSADLAWHQLALEALKPEGLAVIISPLATLYRTNILESQIRRRLVGAGVVVAIVMLPGRLLANTNIPTCVWILRKDVKAEDREILFIDLSDTAESKKNRVEIPSEVICATSELIQSWLKSKHIIDNLPFPATAQIVEETQEMDLMKVFKTMTADPIPRKAELLEMSQRLSTELSYLLAKNQNLMTELRHWTSERSGK